MNETGGPPLDHETGRVAIVGAGLAGASAAETLRREGFAGHVALIGAENELPYERPPLSKGYLLGTADAASCMLRPATYYTEQRIDLHVGVRALELDAGQREVTLDSGERMAFDHLLIASGSEVQRLAVPGEDLAGVQYLRTLADAQTLSAALSSGVRVAVVGAGFIGAEVAAVCRERGLAVTLIEALAVPLERVLGLELGTQLADVHRVHGVDLRLGDGVAAFEGRERVEAVVLASGARIACDIVLVGVGVRPSVAWLRSSDVQLADGVMVDEYCQTSVPGIYAAGDVANWPYTPAGYERPLRVRLEHYDNALRQGEAAARNMLGQAVSYAPVPYFWSDQYDLKLQMVGYAPDWDQVIVRGRLETGSLTAFYLGRRPNASSERRIRAVALVNRVRDLGPARKLVAAGAVLDSAQLADETVDLRRLVQGSVG